MKQQMALSAAWGSVLILSAIRYRLSRDIIISVWIKPHFCFTRKVHSLSPTQVYTQIVRYMMVKLYICHIHMILIKLYTTNIIHAGVSLYNNSVSKINHFMQNISADMNMHLHYILLIHAKIAYEV